MARMTQANNINMSFYIDCVVDNSSVVYVGDVHVCIRLYVNRDKLLEQV